MLICEQPVSRRDLQQMAAAGFGDMVKAVVDVDRQLLAIDADLHADLESLLLESGSAQNSLWGINLYPDEAEDFVEFDSLINIRPMSGNRSRGVDDPETREKILEVAGGRFKMDGAITLHKDLAESGRWSEMPFAQQMANIGSEVFRAENWKKKGKPARMQNAVDRALELLDFTVQTMLHDHRSPRELLRLRELICDYFYGDNQYGSTGEALNRYFDPFSLKAARQRLG